MIEYVWCRLSSHVFRASSKFPSRARMASALKAAETWQQTLSRLHYLCQRRNTANIIYIIIYMYVSTYMHIYIHIYTYILYIYVYIHSGIKWQQYLRACSQRWGERAEQQRPNSRSSWDARDTSAAVLVSQPIWVWSCRHWKLMEAACGSPGDRNSHRRWFPGIALHNCTVWFRTLAAQLHTSDVEPGG